jgi:alpha/beta superfamily hydrolase
MKRGMVNRTNNAQTHAPIAEIPNPVAGLPQPLCTLTGVPALRSFFLEGPAGRLEALLNEGHPDAPYATLLCHPHPLGGGTMHNKVVYHAAKVFSALGWPVLRFNFRGTGLSEGVHHGRDEVDDVLTGLDWLAAQYAKPIVAAGFSFGAATGLEAASSYPDIAGFAALGLPTLAEGREYSYPFFSACHFPKLFLSGDHDQYSPVDHLRAVVDAAPAPAHFDLIPGADHFFTGHLSAMQHALRNWLRETYVLPERPAPNTESKTL